tara:strand:- start:1188 stop:2267 length:1080 start_codon:yes stop_codon:yes gene_type:complete
MCHAFAAQGLEVKLIVPNSRTDSSMRERDILIDRKISKKRNFRICEYSRMNFFSRFRVIDNFIGLRKKILQIEADLYFTRTPIILPLLRKTCKKTIFESHSPLLQNTFPIIDKYYKWILIREMKKNPHLTMITISNELKKFWIRNGVNENKISVAHDGFDTDIFKNQYSKKEIREEKKIDQDKKIVTYIGSLYKDRGIETILSLAKEFADVNFFVAGGPEKPKKYYEEQSSIEGLENIIFLGWLDRKEVNEYLLLSDILLMIWSKAVPTINYCSPMKVFEYMSSGNLIVGHGFITIKEVLADGENAYLADPDSYDELSAKLKIALNDIGQTDMGLKARRLAEAEYSWEKRAKTIIESVL